MGRVQQVPFFGQLPASANPPETAGFGHVNETIPENRVIHRARWAQT